MPPRTAKHTTTTTSTQQYQQTNPLAHRFHNKEVKVALAGLTLNKPAFQVVQEKMKLGWQVWLPDASGLELEERKKERKKDTPLGVK